MLKKETKGAKVQIRVPESLKKLLVEKNIDVAETCRRALKKAVEDKDEPGRETIAIRGRIGPGAGGSASY